jgi:flagellum-specific ATP synthase
VGGHYPAIDIRQSISRLTSKIATPEQRANLQKLREALALYHDSQDLIQLGAYVAGTNQKLDAAIRWRPEIIEFLRQDAQSFCPLPETLVKLEKLAASLG